MKPDNTHISLPETGVLIIGSGLAGLYAALKLAPLPIAILALGKTIEGSASAWAQGGLAAALGAKDHPEIHLQDTLKAGDGLVVPEAASLLTHSAPNCIEDLLRLGVPFDQDEKGELLLSLEAAHSYPRIVRVKGDRAGEVVTKTLLHHVKQQENLTPYIGWQAKELLQDEQGQIRGVKAHNVKDPGQTLVLEASSVILATGGIGGLYSVTTNPVTACGDGLAMAAKRGASFTDIEFIQFHPTALDFGLDPAPLATEALRGEGAVLVNKQGIRFMKSLHEDSELASRDYVARAVDTEIKAGRGAFLDARESIGESFPDRFPTVFSSCKNAGLNPIKECMPITPACHYHMGGITTNLEGKTDLPGLWAIGECASTGVHGANRLASNSLIEALVFAERAAQNIKETQSSKNGKIHIPPSSSTLSNRETLKARQAMHQIAGVCRSEESLQQFLNTLIETTNRQKGSTKPAPHTITVMLMILAAALKRRESRGTHYRTDYLKKKQPKRQRQTLKALREELNLT